MGDVVNLNKFRKAKERAEKAATAAQNRSKHGRSAADKARQTAERAKLDRELSSKRLESDD